MHRFRGNIWDYDSRPQVMQALGYPLPVTDKIPDITEARNIELGLGLQVLPTPHTHDFSSLVHNHAMIILLYILNVSFYCLVRVDVFISVMAGTLLFDGWNFVIFHV